MSIKNKLNRLKPHLSHESKNIVQINMEQVELEDFPYREVWEQNGVLPYYFDGDFCLIREKEYSIYEKHGHYAFAQFYDAVEEWNSANFQHPLSAAGHQPEHFFFFDTETTGLGGSGNLIFILGSASFKGDKVHLKQHILPHPGAEVPLYKSFLESVDYKTMATYNGKSFDWPQVKTRHTLIRDQVPKLPPFGHFDLYHASRRMWKHKLERLKLSIVEKEVLGVERKDDLPGYLAPMIYFDYVQSKNPEGMIGILKHNELDILSLISLYTHLSFQILGMDVEQTEKERFEVGRWFSQIGESASAKKTFSEISEGTSLDALLAKHALAFEYKKQKKWTEAASLWADVAEKGEAPRNLEASIELAKIYEHREMDIKKALQYTTLAQSIYHEDPTFQSKDLNSEILIRLERLNKKLK
ncbi:ribonuclease H-like domain-containing protein [Bacillus sp. S/N-304-OC-R1]|uniref:ribonuclease H-like domain-containing protein n=1 Tax=Bacillus sp. S/N-304-OC-R1 TaxID=2758034 RepID=UPI001C8D2B74|nr:ribonuclease H-like domain-containing protein [Bacillus sp. S/N-304-OC-R1]MBY0122638.1 ribonuclease H-like domain-containing protein [Bacillus sp. S/N-304-OC-R1]